MENVSSPLGDERARGTTMSEERMPRRPHLEQAENQETLGEDKRGHEDEGRGSLVNFRLSGHALMNKNERKNEEPLHWLTTFGEFPPANTQPERGTRPRTRGGTCSYYDISCGEDTPTEDMPNEVKAERNGINEEFKARDKSKKLEKQYNKERKRMTPQDAGGQNHGGRRRLQK